MKKTTQLATIILTLLCISVVSSYAGKSHSVKGYTKKDGTYVAPHKQTDPDKSKSNNWNSKGNTNPYTGKDGSVDPDKKK